jgi:hypothetical protein
MEQVVSRHDLLSRHSRNWFPAKTAGARIPTALYIFTDGIVIVGPWARSRARLTLTWVMLAMVRGGGSAWQLPLDSEVCKRIDEIAALGREVTSEEIAHAVPGTQRVGLDEIASCTLQKGRLLKNQFPSEALLTIQTTNFAFRYVLDRDVKSSAAELLTAFLGERFRNTATEGEPLPADVPSG